MLNRTFLLRDETDGSRRCAQITAVVEEFEGQLDSNPKRVKFKAKIGGSNFEELIDYNDLMELIEEQKEFDNHLAFPQDSRPSCTENQEGEMERTS